MPWKPEPSEVLSQERFDSQEDFPHGAHHREVAIHIGNHTLRSGDRGSVIVGGSMEVAPQLADPLAAELSAEEAAAKLRRSADKKAVWKQCLAT